MDVNKFVENLTDREKALLVHGNGAWHTNSVGNIPSVMMTDGPHGLRKQSDQNDGINDSAKAVCFPTGSALASSWNRQNAAAIGALIAEEALSQGVSVVLGPGINIKRSPLCGRNFEYFSEDPYLAGELAVNYVNAMQSKGVGCSVKHFAVNSQETRRMTVDAITDERALREIYLAAFENVVKNARPYTVMASYNKINGVSACHSKRLLNGILREEWGFDGLVMSDWGACYDMAQGLCAGMDLEMPDGGYYHEQKTLKALKEGGLAQDDLNRACRNVVNLINKCSGKKTVEISDAETRRRKCREIAADCAVLLKNDGVLPLSENDEITVIGELAEKPRFQGAGSSHVNAECKSFLRVLDENGVKYRYAKGYSICGDTVNAKLEKQAVNLALRGGSILFFGGLTDAFEGEGHDRSKLDIPNCQQSLLDKISAINGNVAFVMFGGSPVVMPWLSKIKSLLNMYLGGERVTEAAFDLLYGKVSPSGRLAETYPSALDDTPCYRYYNTKKDVDEHRESIFVGYRYYNTFGVKPLFPFGYGLSYSQFKYENFSARVQGDNVYVSVTVSNVGNFDAGEVVQIYVDNCECGYMRAKRELRAFDKIFLKRGESKALNFVLDERAFCIYTESGFTKVKGDYTVSVCSSADDVLLSQTVFIDGQNVSGRDCELYPSYFVKGRKPFEVDSEEFYSLSNAEIKPDKSSYVRGEFTLLNTFEDMASSVGLIRLLLKIVKRMAKKSSPTKSESDPVTQMIYQGALTTPLISLMSVARIPAKYVMFLYYHANRKRSKAFKALFGKYEIE